MRELRVLSPTAILGYGFPEESFMEGMKKNPDVIAVDAGSSDPGPYYLGAGVSFTDRSAVKRDLEFMLSSAVERNIPVIIGTAGGSGANSHLDWCIEIIKEISKEKELSFKMATIQAQIDNEIVMEELKAGRVSALHPAPMPTEKDVTDSVRIVAQMGEEPFIKALESGAQVIVGGRTYDPVCFSSLAIKNGFDKGLAIHMGKILECAAIAALPGSGSDCMFGTLREDHFELEPLSKERKCTTLSVAAHTLYEKSNPTSLPGPGGVLDLTQTTFEQNKENSVIVRGSKFVPTEEGKYFIKLEGVKKVGYRTVSVAATCDPIMMSKIDDIIAAVKAKVNSNFEGQNFGDYFLDIRVYGKNGASLYKGIQCNFGSEIGIVIEAVGETQEIADTICSFARSTMLHYGYEGRIATAGNLAFPFSPSDFHAGEVYEFSVYSLMDTSEDPCKYFPVDVKMCDKGELK
ncbi:MAG: DUF1446 domain-containing protein [Clostridioides sp.]|jgi:hypothetical protein|nr:DUF1446 domain-containing protein [Clostridioides sp.]